MNIRATSALAVALALLAGLVSQTLAADPRTGWWPPFVPDLPIPGPTAPPPAGTEPLLIEGAECAGLSGFRADWDRPIPLAADGATTVVDKGNFGKGPVAVWNDPQ